MAAIFHSNLPFAIDPNNSFQRDHIPCFLHAHSFLFFIPSFICFYRRINSEAFGKGEVYVAKNMHTFNYGANTHTDVFDLPFNASDLIRI